MSEKELMDQSTSSSWTTSTPLAATSSLSTEHLLQRQKTDLPLFNPEGNNIVTQAPQKGVSNSVEVSNKESLEGKPLLLSPLTELNTVIVREKSATSTSTLLIVKELEKFDPTTPEEEDPPFSPLFGASHGPNLTESEDKGIVQQLAEYMELHTIHPVIKSFLVGSISGTCSTVLFQPLDLIKTRLQAQPIRHGASAPTLGASRVAATAVGPNGLFTILGHIVRDEKVHGLWKGMTPSLTRCVPGVGLYFASIHGLKIAFDIHGEPTPLQSVLLGVTGRSISGVMMIPFTVIKTRFESTVYHYGSIREALYSIYRKEGFRGLTCGLLPTLLRDAPFSGLYLLMYTTTKRTVPQDWIESSTFGPYVRFSCGIVAGIGASLVTQPADVLKTKMQLYPNKFHSIPQVVAYVYKKYGAQGYFKGLLPRMIRRTLIAAMSWTVYEQVMKSFGLK